jgi:hypothetical protein
MNPQSVAAAFAVGLLLAIVLYIGVASYNAVMSLRSGSTKPGRTSTSCSSNATTSCRRSSRPCVA